MTASNLDDVLVLIPARMASTRLPGKPLADICGLPMIVQVALRAKEAEIGRVVIAVDDEEVFEAVSKAGFEVVMTRKDHQSGSDRIFEALHKVDPDASARIVVNVQGDLPTIDPETIRLHCARWKRRPSISRRSPSRSLMRKRGPIRTLSRSWGLRSPKRVFMRSISPARQHLMAKGRSITISASMHIAGLRSRNSSRSDRRP
ncbi:hypothetical protein AJ87_01805 [Rhizobium yanglingense]|nr:hypothetical protein AJ87_01805 [Rhizobium yanglingense]